MITEKELEQICDKVQQVVNRTERFSKAIDNGRIDEMTKAFVEAQCDVLLSTADIPTTDEGRLEAVMMISSATAEIKEAVDSILAKFSDA